MRRLIPGSVGGKPVNFYPVSSSAASFGRPGSHFPPEIRKIIYTTNAIESLNSSFRKISRHRNLFPTIEFADRMPANH